MAQFSLDEPIDDDTEYAIFDDMQGGITFWKSYKCWLGQQQQFYATDKYKGKKLIMWGRPTIYLANSDPRHDKEADYEWLDGNCVFVCLDKPIFRASTEYNSE